MKFPEIKSFHPGQWVKVTKRGHPYKDQVFQVNQVLQDDVTVFDECVGHVELKISDIGLTVFSIEESNGHHPEEKILHHIQDLVKDYRKVARIDRKFMEKIFTRQELEIISACGEKITNSTAEKKSEIQPYQDKPIFSPQKFSGEENESTHPKSIFSPQQFPSSDRGEKITNSTAEKKSETQPYQDKPIFSPQTKGRKIGIPNRKPARGSIEKRLKRDGSTSYVYRWKECEWKSKSKSIPSEKISEVLSMHQSGCSIKQILALL